MNLDAEINRLALATGMQGFSVPTMLDRAAELIDSLRAQLQAAQEELREQRESYDIDTAADGKRIRALQEKLQAAERERDRARESLRRYKDEHIDAITSGRGGAFAYTKLGERIAELEALLRRYGQHVLSGRYLQLRMACVFTQAEIEDGKCLCGWSEVEASLNTEEKT